MVISDTTTQVMYSLPIKFEDISTVFIELTLHLSISVKTSETQTQPVQIFKVLKI